MNVLDKEVLLKYVQDLKENIDDWEQDIENDNLAYGFYYFKNIDNILDEMIKNNIITELHKVYDDYVEAFDK